MTPLVWWLVAGGTAWLAASVALAVVIGRAVVRRDRQRPTSSTEPELTMKRGVTMNRPVSGPGIPPKPPTPPSPPRPGATR